VGNDQFPPLLEGVSEAGPRHAHCLADLLRDRSQEFLPDDVKLLLEFGLPNKTNLIPKSK
jgi:hypothetical protein